MTRKAFIPPHIAPFVRTRRTSYLHASAILYAIIYKNETEVDMQEFTEQALLEILQDTSTDMFTQAQCMYTLCAKHNYTQSSLAKRIGVSQSCICNKTRLLQFSAVEREAILRHGLTERHARALLRAKPPRRQKLIVTAGSMHLTVQQTEELVDKYQSADQITISANEVIEVDSFFYQTQAAAERLSTLGYHTACMIESGERWRRITITVSE